MVQPERIAFLFEKMMNNSCSEQELDELLYWMRSPENELEAGQMILREVSAETNSPGDQQITERLEARMEEILRKPVVQRRFQPVWWAAAAILLLFAGITILRPKNNEKISAPLVQSPPKDPHPGKNGAILTLADGSEFVLDSVPNGKIAINGAANITLNQGKLSYGNYTDRVSAEPVQINTLTTPEGRQFQLELEDGTKVWLNAASSISYPTVFHGTERVVNVTGEVYFEVAKNKAKPFRVRLADHSSIEVLGTHFNVNAYADEAAFRTTLLEGSVKFTSATQGSVIMKPGEQTQLTNNGMKLVKSVDIEHVMAWKYGFFSFQDASLAEVMKQLSRWYDLDIVYEGKIPEIDFNGEIDKNLTLSQVLNGLSATRINYIIKNGKTIIIRP